MATYSTVNTDFTGGLMSPHLRGRIDIDKFKKGLQQMENFLPSIQGPTRYREGFQWIREEVGGNIRLIEFTINNQSRFLIALSAGLLQVYSTDGTLLYTRGGGVDVNGDPVAAADEFGNSITVPYLDDQIMNVRYSREVETMVFTHPLHPPYSLTANTIYDELQLTATSEYVTTSGVTANINGTFLNTDAETLNGKPKWILYDDPVAQTLEYWYIQYNGTDWEFVVAAGHPTLTAGHVYYTNTSDEDDVPVSGWTLGANGVDIADIPTITEGQSNLQDSSNTPLYAGAVGSEGLYPWQFEQIKFTSHPFQKIDRTDTILTISNEDERIRLISTASDWSSLSAVDLDANEWYTEYKFGNQYGLARIREYVSDSEVLVDPVESVVNIEDPSVRLAAIIGDETNAPWTDRDGVPDGDVHVRADALIFRTSNIGSWIRIGGDRLFTNVCDPVDSAAYNSQDVEIRWAQITDYRGVEDHPVEFLYDELNSGDLDSGTVYEIYDWGNTITAISVMDGSGLKEVSDRSAFVRKDVGTPRFTMNAFAISGGTANGSTTLTEPVGAVTSTDMIIANMSTQRQFDVVEVDSSTIRSSASNLIVPSGDVSVYDLTNDPEQFETTPGNLAYHTATVTSSRIFFDDTRDSGRFLLGELVDKWVLLRINGNNLFPYSAEVDVLGSIPRDELTDDIKNDGVFTRFRWGAWYTDNYPSAVSFYEQRRVFAGSRNNPNLVWLSNLNDPTDFRTVEDDGQVLDTTGITYQLGTGSTIISWLEAGPTLIVGTESNEWQLRPNEFSAAITPSNIRITQETSIGSKVQGKRIGGSVFFPHISGKQLHEFKFDFQSQQFVIETVTKLVPDLFEDDPIRSMGYQFNPNSAIWIVTENGNLFTLTYRREDDYYAWAKHSSSGGTFKDVTVVPKGDTENSEDQVWIIVERDGANHLERMAVSFTDTLVNDFKLNARFLDSYVLDTSLGTPTQFSAPARCIIDGQIRVVVDGVDLGDLDASPGLNNLPDGVTATQYILVGIPYRGIIQLNPLAIDTSGKNAYGNIKRINSIRLYLYKSMGYKIGFDINNLEPIAPSGGTSLFTGFTEEHTILDSNFDVDETPIIVQDNAYPLTIVSCVLKTDFH